MLLLSQAWCVVCISAPCGLFFCSYHICCIFCRWKIWTIFYWSLCKRVKRRLHSVVALKIVSALENLGRRRKKSCKRRYLRSLLGRRIVCYIYLEFLPSSVKNVTFDDTSLEVDCKKWNSSLQLVDLSRLKDLGVEVCQRKIKEGPILDPINKILMVM